MRRVEYSPDSRHVGACRRVEPGSLEGGQHTVDAKHDGVTLKRKVGHQRFRNPTTEPKVDRRATDVGEGDDRDSARSVGWTRPGLR